MLSCGYILQNILNLKLVKSDQFTQRKKVDYLFEIQPSLVPLVAASFQALCPGLQVLPIFLPSSQDSTTHWPCSHTSKIPNFPQSWGSRVHSLKINSCRQSQEKNTFSALPYNQLGLISFPAPSRHIFLHSYIQSEIQNGRFSHLTLFFKLKHCLHGKNSKCLGRHGGACLYPALSCQRQKEL